MGRHTNRKIKTTSVSTSEIREVFNSDTLSKPISNTIRKASEMFIDGNVTNSINNNFIDGNYCPADGGETKKDKFTRQPFSWGHWRNYGGVETTEVGIPYIYWKNVIDYNNVEHIPQGADVDYFNTLSTIPTIIMQPNQAKITSNLDNNIVNSYNLANSNQSAMFSGNKLIDTILSTKVGVVYGTFTDGVFTASGYEGGVPEFKIKVTPRIVDNTIITKYIKLSNNDTETKEFTVSPSFTGSAAISAIFAKITELLVLIGESNPQFWAMLWDWFIGPNSPIKTIIQWPGWSSISSWLRNLFTSGPLVNTLSGVWAYLGPVLLDLAVISGIVWGIDLIWDLVNNEAQINSALYQYAATVLGNYTTEDLAGSEYVINFDNKFIKSDTGKSIHYIQDGIGSDTYNLNNYNFSNLPFSTDNLIDQFPTNSSSLSKYLNIDFFGKLTQFDYCVPPPIIEYMVELVPVYNCELHPDYITAFSVRLLPEQYLAPEFAIDTIREGQNNVLYWNSNIEFINARYSDFIYLKDTQRNSSNFLGLFGTYNNVAINTANNETSGIFNPSVIINNYNGRNINAIGSELYNAPGNSPMTIPSSNYEVYFMKEANPNRLYNPFFRTEKDINDTYLYGLKSFWEHSDSVVIKSGAASKKEVTVSECYLKQHYEGLTLSSSSFKRYYIMQVNILNTSGSIYLKTSEAFQNKIYLYQLGPDNWLNDYSRVAIDGSNGAEVNHFSIYPEDYGVSYINNMIRFNGSGNYFLVLETLSSCNKDIYFIMSTDFIGSVNQCTLQYLPKSKVGDSSRGAYNMELSSNISTKSFLYKNEMLPYKLMRLYFDPFNTESNNVTFNFETKKYLRTVNNITKVVSSVDNITVNYYFANEDLNYSETISTNGVVDYISGEVINDTFEFNYQGDVELREVLITTYYTADSIYVNTTYSPVVSFSCTNNSLFSLRDNSAMLTDASVDLSGTELGKNVFPNDTTIPKFTFSLIKSRLNSLDISNCIYLTDDVKNIKYITNSLIANNSPITGDLVNIISIPTVELNETNLSIYGIGTPNYSSPDINPRIIWKNSLNTINVNYLNKLLYDLNYSSTINGYLDIKGSNPKITDVTTLANIDTLVARGWTVLYNNVEEWTYEGIMTVGGVSTEDGFPFNGFGYINTFMGSIEPIIPGSYEILEIIWIADDTNMIILTSFDIDGNIYSPFKFDNNITKILINNIEYVPIWNEELSQWIVSNINENPFTAVGETCDIKLKYTILSSKPIITLINSENDPIDIEIGTNYTDAGATAFDETDGDITDNIVIVNNLDVNTVGSYTITYNVTNSLGIAADEVIRTVNVNLPLPVITLIGYDTITLPQGYTYIELGATANDYTDGSITSSIVITGSVNSNVMGTYTIHYNVVNSFNVAAIEVVRTVNIISAIVTGSTPTVDLWSVINNNNISSWLYNDILSLISNNVVIQNSGSTRRSLTIPLNIGDSIYEYIPNYELSTWLSGWRIGLMEYEPNNYITKCIIYYFVEGVVTQMYYYTRS